MLQPFQSGSGKLPGIIVGLVLLVFFLAAAVKTPAAEPVTVILDAHGNRIEVKKPFTRIISLYSAHTENICSFGAAELLVGISTSDDYPEEILDRTRFSYREDPEKFIAYTPDLVLVRPMIERSYPQFLEKLRRSGITVISLQPNSVSEMFDYWRTLGVLTGKVQAANDMITDFQNRLQHIKDSVLAIDDTDRPLVYFESIHTKSKTFAPESIGAYVLEQAGGRNVASDAVQVRKTNIAYFGKEQLLSNGEEVDFFLAQVGRMNPVSVDTITSEPGFDAIKAVREKKVYLIEEQLVSRPTLRIITGIEKLHNLFFNTTAREPGLL
ncbi:ABC transporter substrate-binding protein [Desulforhopalus singaporensis]|uniref:Iron complex transport system substrate-binding protein n=1 Tax=Desulforhopalus singaporensis TaxID=91360 RepID=A0A1H0NX64_9BACT|nr:ABC transporter substrate-binding protein [Desulforhopalus singaporensis]SDO97271.1 iron complex transport system substrate-binding protein [Desulforhopalus singaporensis]